MTDYKKLYEEALERAKYWAEGKCVEDFDDSPQNVLDFVFPEAKESEDEKIRKFLIKCVQQPMGTDLLNGIKKDDVIAWLEKRGEQKPADTPNFKVGDWCIDNEDDTIFQIVKVLHNIYTYRINAGETCSCTHCSLEEVARLWTIQDAKDGDVLADDYSIIIFRKIGNESWGDVIDFYVGYNHDSNKFNIQSGKSHYGNTNTTSFKPATKEQRYFLFTKMKENGYEWDAEKKVLRKIEQKPTSSKQCADYYNENSELKMPRLTDFENEIAQILFEREYDGSTETDDDIARGRLEYELTAIRLAPKLLDLAIKEKKSTWSEEDEMFLNLSLGHLTVVKNRFGEESGKVGDCIHWLKSLKEKL